MRTAWAEIQPGWDHDHCEGCWATFGPGGLAEGWTTTDEHPHGAGYHWVCDDCHAALAGPLLWR